MMKRSLTMTIAAAAVLLGLAFVPRATAHCGQCGLDGASKAKWHCPQCEKLDRMCEKCVMMKMKMKKKHGHHHAWSAIGEAVCMVNPTQDHTASGTVRFIQGDGPGVKIVADIEGLSPNGTHAIHVHEYGDCSSSDGKSAGGHYNPEGHPHALPGDEVRHAGDLGNLQADAQGRAHYELTVDNICIVGHKNPILGRAVIIHAKADDGGQPTGNAGARVGCGVIGIANTPANSPATAAPATQPSQP